MKNDLQNIFVVVVVFKVLPVKMAPTVPVNRLQNQCLMQFLTELLVDVKGNNFVIRSTSAPLLSRLSK